MMFPFQSEMSALPPKATFGSSERVSRHSTAIEFKHIKTNVTINHVNQSALVKHNIITLRG